MNSIVNPEIVSVDRTEERCAKIFLFFCEFRLIGTTVCRAVPLCSCGRTYRSLVRRSSLRNHICHRSVVSVKCNCRLHIDTDPIRILQRSQTSFTIQLSNVSALKSTRATTAIRAKHGVRTAQLRRALAETRAEGNDSPRNQLIL